MRCGDRRSRTGSAGSRATDCRCPSTACTRADWAAARCRWQCCPSRPGWLSNGRLDRNHDQNRTELFYIGHTDITHTRTTKPCSQLIQDKQEVKKIIHSRGWPTFQLPEINDCTQADHFQSIQVLGKRLSCSRFRNICRNGNTMNTW